MEELQQMQVTSDRQNERILDLAEDDEGAIWLAASNAGLIRIERNGRNERGRGL